MLNKVPPLYRYTCTIPSARQALFVVGRRPSVIRQGSNGSASEDSGTEVGGAREPTSQNPETHFLEVTRQVLRTLENNTFRRITQGKQHSASGRFKHGRFLEVWTHVLSESKNDHGYQDGHHLLLITHQRSTEPIPPTAAAFVKRHRKAQIGGKIKRNVAEQFCYTLRYPNTRSTCNNHFLTDDKTRKQNTEPTTQRRVRSALYIPFFRLDFYTTPANFRFFK